MKFRKLVLVLAMLLGVTACAGEAPELIDFLGVIDDSVTFDGMTFRIFKKGAADGNFDLSVEKEKGYSLDDE